MRKVIIIYGPPGAGKGTQANLLAGKLGLIHFDTGRYLEQILHDPEKQNDAEIKKAREIFDSGALVTPSFVLKIISQKSKEISKSGFGIVFSGSPRTLYETLGDEKNQGLIALLEAEYGKENIIPIFLKIDPKVSILRNKNRKVCSVCGTAILYNDADQHKTCPLCGGELRTRIVDNPAVFKTRIKEYEERTKPIIGALKKHSYKIMEINGIPLPYKVFDEILKKLKFRKS